jgi:hypothetical protein
MASWSTASVDYRNKVIKTYPDPPDLFENVLVHELTHIVFREYVKFGSNVPLWLDEGVATFIKRKKRPHLLKRRLRGIKRANALLGLKELTALDSAISFPQDKADTFYIQSLSLVYFLIKQFGKDKFNQFCYALRQGRSLERSLSFAYEINNLDDLEMRWQHYFFD